MNEDELKTGVCNNTEAVGVYKEFNIAGEAVKDRFLVHCVYEYDEHGKVVSKEWPGREGKQEAGGWKYDRKYDDNGNEVECITTGGVYCTFKEIRSETRKYDGNGQEIQYKYKCILRLSGREEDAVREDRTIWKVYDDEGRLFFSKCLDNAMKCVEFECYHNGQKILTARTRLNKDKGDIHDDFCGWTVLDHDGRPFSYHNTNGWSTVWKYDETGSHKHEFDSSAISDTDYDVNGKKVRRTVRWHDGGVSKYGTNRHGDEICDYQLFKKCECRAHRNYDENGNVVRLVCKVRKNEGDYMPAADGEWEIGLDAFYDNEYYSDDKTLRKRTIYERLMKISDLADYHRSDFWLYFGDVWQIF